MGYKRSSDMEKKVHNRYKSEIKSQYKIEQSKKNKRKSKAPMAICLVIGIGIGWITEFNIIDFIENMSKYKLVIVKKEDDPINNELSLNDENLNKEEEKENSDKEVGKVENSNIEQETQQQKQETKETKQDKIKKARQSIINQCGDEFRDVIYIGETKFKGGNYYSFGINIDGDVGGDMSLLVDTKTFKTYESSVDGYFGEYRGYDNNVFTLDMAIMKIKNELGWDENTKYSLMEERYDGFIIRTGFEAEGGTGTGETYYVTRESVKVYGGE
ncbi:hypothetical protein [Romboutsia sp.]|uniref:hypothetical protein n=1 Tax=Romboutsia sp. TaxID=1965302 RepID=UPI003F39DBB5